MIQHEIVENAGDKKKNVHDFYAKIVSHRDSS